jgi:hypothetical protein
MKKLRAAFHNFEKAPKWEWLKRKTNLTAAAAWHVWSLPPCAWHLRSGSSALCAIMLLGIATLVTIMMT